MNGKPSHVIFADKKLEKAFEELKKGRFEGKILHSSMQKAISHLKENPMCGTKIPKKLWPREYSMRYGITNLWKHDLPSAWRLVYTIQTDETMILSVILKWFSHKDYEKRFGY
jgi:Txe/YoeB family toxin of Txe-Axe toxin-antitoxin module